MISKKLGQVFWRFVSILFLIFEKVDKQKIGPGFYLRFVSILFLIFEKGISKQLG